MTAEEETPPVNDPPRFDTGMEVATVLRSHGIARRQRFAYRDLTILEALDEAEAWLRDERDYEPKFHNRPWQSMTVDVALSLATRGTRLQRATPSIETLLTQLKTAQLGPTKSLRPAALSSLRSARDELAAPPAAAAAFDDLFKAASRKESPRARLDSLVLALNDCLLSGGNAAVSRLDLLADVMSDIVDGVKSARSILGADVTFDRSDLSRKANLRLKERVELCHQLLTRSPVGSRAVVWLCYDEARIRPHALDFGPMTFYDSKDLTEAYEHPDKQIIHAVLHPDGSSGIRPQPRPTEFPRIDDAQSQQGWPLWPPALKDWVLVRVDLGTEPIADPISQARRQVENLVRTAAFYGEGSSWRLQAGYAYFRDGEWHGRTLHWHTRDQRLLSDNTDSILRELEPKLANLFPVRDPQLQDLLDAFKIVDDHRDDLDGRSVIHSVRAIEKVAGMCGVAEWDKYLTENYATQWARDRLRQDIWSTVDAATLPMGDISIIIDEKKLYTDQHKMKVDAAAELIPSLRAATPAKHATSRRLRDAASWTASPAHLLAVVQNHEADYARLIERLARCRNSLTHGGPFREATAETVLALARTQGKQALDTALRAALDGRTTATEQAERQAHEKVWREAIPGLARASEALR